MKIAVPHKTTHTQPKEEAILPLVPVVKDINVEEAKDPTRYATFQLQTVPGDNNAPKVKFAMLVARGLETPREMIDWYTNVLRVCDGLNLNANGNEGARVQVIRTLARGTILTYFNEHVEQGVIDLFAVQQQQAQDAVGPHDPAGAETLDA